MNRLLILLLFALPIPVLAGMPNDPSDEAAYADSIYATGDHHTALNIYSALAGSHASPALYYNLGNCHFKLGNKAQAVLWYERAHRLAPGDADINANLDLARAQVVDRVNAAPGIALGGKWSAFLAGANVDSWAKRSLWLCLATFVFLAVLLWVQAAALRRIVVVVASVLGVCTVLAVSLAAYRTIELRNDKEAIVMVPKVDVRSEPRDGGLAVFVLHEGTKLNVQQVRDGWCEVRLANGNVGWMKAEGLERI